MLIAIEWLIVLVFHWINYSIIPKHETRSGIFSHRLIINMILLSRQSPYLFYPYHSSLLQDGAYTVGARVLCCRKFQWRKNYGL
jgi:hypothetical protein